ncbi:hypothetical protein C1X59_08460 [Pseudomonas sp. FW215-R2]|uniref:hypothetical protein n=1 Tax=unclassified Pseudomonas TaxID=196821 RepID=UPI000C888B1F|nr:MULTISPECIES: hypothetical protein [unclassified Pseudomonas]PMX02343.1 hypothetical protein C1X59_08460 [Pseudomonas sp. FW215-R2]PMX11029.1 hypothetical protein C1X60_07750 [Pseudomonas sp. FW215-L1]PMX20786.1 hypothetical protein C1X57_19810 [Pseudomonas sp. FW215-E1]PNA21743.1 hypothetical protein C1X58_28170 [Pseudomonas sp. FW215-R4]
MLHIPNNNGTALINVLSSYPDLDELERDFDILYFLDLCAGIDAAVIQDELAYVGKIKSFNSAQVNPIIRALLDSGTLKRYYPTDPDPVLYGRNLIASPIAQEVLSVLPTRVPFGSEHEFISLMACGSELAADMAMEKETGISLVLTAHSLPLYAKIPSEIERRASYQQLKYTLAATYPGFRDILCSMGNSLAPKEIIRIPPIALEVLELADSKEDLGQAVLEVRGRYEKMRKNLIELQDLLDSNDASSSLKLREVERYKKSLSKLFSSSELDGVTVVTTFTDDISEAVDLSDFSTDGVEIDWPKMLSFLVKYAYDINWKLRFRPLHASKQRYLELSTNRVAGIVRNKFGHQLNSADVIAVNKYAQAVRTI